MIIGLKKETCGKAASLSDSLSCSSGENPKLKLCRVASPHPLITAVILDG